MSATYKLAPKPEDRTLLFNLHWGYRKVPGRKPKAKDYAAPATDATSRVFPVVLDENDAPALTVTLMYLGMGHMPYDKQEMHEYRATVADNEGNKETFPFFTGTGWDRWPSGHDVLECLISDAVGYENSRNFEEWAADCGYDADSRRAENVYREVGQQSEKLRRLLPLDLSVSDLADLLNGDTDTDTDESERE